MLRLSSRSPAPVTWEPRPGVSITQVPLDTIGYEAATAEAERQGLMLRQGGAVLADYGLEGAAFLDRDELRAGLATFLLFVEFGVASITGWSGIGDEDGNPLQPDRSSIAALCRDRAIAAGVANKALGRIHSWVAEGNASAVSPNGGDGAAETTAPTAGTKAPLAPAADEA